MIKIVAENFVKPGQVEEFIKKAAPLVAASQKEAGCVYYTLNQDENDKTHLTFIEQWIDEDAITTHNNSDHFTKIVPVLGEFCAKPGKVSIYREIK